VIGDLQLNPDGSLAEIQDFALEIQDATTRLLTDQSAATGFELFPNTGASLNAYIGEPMSLDLLQSIDRSSRRALVIDKRFDQRTQVRTLPEDKNNARVVVLAPTGQGYVTMNVDLEFDPIRGVAAMAVQQENPWLWRRGRAQIQRSSSLWRAWYAGVALWRLSPDGLIVPNHNQGSLSSLGVFQEPLVGTYGTSASGLIFCGFTGSPLNFSAVALTTPSGWLTENPLMASTSLPHYDLPDGVWCDADTDWNTVIVISGVTAGHYAHATSQWTFRSIKTGL
jgi:hypothetical protein